MKRRSRAPERRHYSVHELGAERLPVIYLTATLPLWGYTDVQQHCRDSDLGAARRCMMPEGLQLSARVVASLLARIYGPSIYDIPRFGGGGPVQRGLIDLIS